MGFPYDCNTILKEVQFRTFCSKVARSVGLGAAGASPEPETPRQSKRKQSLASKGHANLEYNPNKVPGREQAHGNHPAVEVQSRGLTARRPQASCRIKSRQGPQGLTDSKPLPDRELNRMAVGTSREMYLTNRRPRGSAKHPCTKTTSNIHEHGEAPSAQHELHGVTPSQTPRAKQCPKPTNSKPQRRTTSRPHPNLSSTNQVLDVDFMVRGTIQNLQNQWFWDIFAGTPKYRDFVNFIQ